MSSTRRAETGTPFRQERFCSSAEFDRGLMGNLVARRCEVLERDEDRELVWFIQLFSHAPGGLAKLAAELLASFPERVATKTMHTVGFKPGQIYNTPTVKRVRWDMDEDVSLCDFPIEGDQQFDDETNATKPPTQYPAQAFADRCREAAVSGLEQMLAEICLDPGIKLAGFGPWYFPALVETVREFMAAWIASKRAAQVVTELGGQVYETLDYARDGRCLVMIDGLARTGKTFAAKAWCELHPGQARYVQVPSSNDDIGFFRAIAKSLGVSINQNSKAQQLRDRIEDVLQRGHLTVVFDEAHYLWPQGNYREALPSRVNWIMTALANQGVPVALVTTPQFIRSQKAIERKSCWTSEQFIGRIGHYQKLPDSLTQADLEAVSKAFLPEGCAKSIETLVVYAQGSSKYLAGIESVVRRARFMAGKANRQKTTFADVREAIKGSVIPSDSALAVALAEPRKAGRSRAIATPLQALETPPATPAQAGRGTNRQDSPEALAATQSLGADRARQDLAAA